MINILTMAGMRPRAWRLCKRWMNAQDYQDQVKWIVVDDGEDALDMSGIRDDWEVSHVRRKPYWRQGENTQALNITSGLMHLDDKDAKLVIIEDDDYYAKGYLSAVDKWLDWHDLVGECNSRYYNVKSKRWAYCNNMKHCSLMSTAMKGEDAILLFKAIAERKSRFIDLNLWDEFDGSKMLYETEYTVGIKGLPGRPGIGVGHRLQSGPRDTNGATLRKWIGGDAAVYEGRSPYTVEQLERLIIELYQYGDWSLLREELDMINEMTERYNNKV
jgi:hypothetical protein